MIVLDIIVTALLVAAIVNGFRKGFFVQLAGLAGLLVGAWLAIRCGRGLGLWLGIDGKYAAVAGFMIILIFVILVVATVGRLFKRIFGFAGLGIIDRLGGLVLSLAKTGLIIGLVLWGYDSLNRTRGWTDREVLESSLFYRPMVDITVLVFPYIESLKDSLAPLWENEPERPEPHNDQESTEILNA